LELGIVERGLKLVELALVGRIFRTSSTKTRTISGSN
jgi:hypothetical protein